MAVGWSVGATDRRVGDEIGERRYRRRSERAGHHRAIVDAIDQHHVAGRRREKRFGGRLQDLDRDIELLHRHRLHHERSGDARKTPA